MALSSEQKMNVRRMAKTLIEARTDGQKSLDRDGLAMKVAEVLGFIGLSADEAEKNEIVGELEYEVSVRHTTGSAIFSDYDNLHDWYSRLSLDSQPFWERYRRYLSEKSSLDITSIDLLDKKTLPDILNCLADPNEEFEGRRVRRGLIIGDVQSGKTSTYIGMMCKAADAGYKAIILLAGTTESLRQQTQERVDEGIVGFTYPKGDQYKDGVKVGVGNYVAGMPAEAFTSVQRDFVEGANKIVSSLNQRNTIVVFVCKKNVSVLNKLYKWLKRQNIDEVKGYVDVPMLLIDDEADNASVNTKKADTDPTKTNKIIRLICNLFKNTTYVGFTATPFANIFIDPDSVDSMKQADLFPEDFIYTLPTPSTYIGARRLFDADGDHFANLRYIADIDEPDYCSEEYRDMVALHLDELNSGPFYFQHKKQWDGVLPGSLREAVLCFFLANVVRDLRGDSAAPRSMLVNMSRFVDVQRTIRGHVEEIYNTVRRTICCDFSDDYSANAGLPLFVELRSLWRKHFAHIDIDERRVLAKAALVRATEDIKVMMVNGSKASDSLDYKSCPSLRVIAVGGLALSRGLTLEGLLVSYFYRNTATFDVLMQMGRWFGYRHRYDDLFQVWTPQASANWYAEIAEASDLLKEDIKHMFEQRLTPKDFGLRVRDNCRALRITAQNKMRTASNFRVRIAYYGNIYDTPYLSLNAEDNAANLRQVQALAGRLVGGGFRQAFAGPRSRGKDVADNTIRESRYFADVPKAVVREFLAGLRCSMLNMSFNTDNLLQFIDSPATEGIDAWDIVFEGGDAKVAYQIAELANIDCTSRAIYDHSNAIQISSRRRLLGTREGQFCLDARQIAEAERVQRQEWAAQGLSGAETKAIPLKAYFQYLPKRKPVLIVMLIRPTVPEEEPTRPNCKAFKKFIEDIGSNQLAAFAIGFPGVKDEESAVAYKVNKVWLRENGLDNNDDETDDEEYDG